MKKPIDPNLENFDNDELLNSIDSNNDDNAGFDFKKPAADLFSSENQKSASLDNNEFSDFKMREKQYHKHSSSSTHHHSSSSSHGSGSHSHSSGSHTHSSGSHSSKSHRKKKKKKMPIAARIAIAVLAIILVLIVGVFGSFFFLEHQGKSNLTNVEKQTNYEEKISYNGHDYVYNDNIVSIAFIGVDKRELGLENGAVGTAGQADATIVITVDTSTGKAKVLAIPRDTMVEVEIYSDSNEFLRNEEMQLCLSYAYGNGTDTSAENVTTSLSRILYNVPINKYFALDLNGIAPINDAIGGVTVESLYDLPKQGIKKGDKVHLIGDLTEAYVRTRDMNTVNASLNRTARQVQYIKAFAAQLAPAVINDFSVVSRLYSTATDYSTTNISLSDATYLASLLISKNITDFETVTIEGEMKASTKQDYADFVYAEFYPDEDALMQTVLDTFYTQID